MFWNVNSFHLMAIYERYIILDIKWFTDSIYLIIHERIKLQVVFRCFNVRNVPIRVVVRFLSLANVALEIYTNIYFNIKLCVS